MTPIILGFAAEFRIHATEQVWRDRRRAFGQTALLSVSPFTHEEQCSQEVSPLRAFGHGLLVTARIFIESCVAWERRYSAFLAAEIFSGEGDEIFAETSSRYGCAM
jgi:hypothetical protein